jgi:membrane-associated protein
VARLHWAGYLFGGAVIVFFVAVLLIRRALERREARHWAEEHPGTKPPSA